MATTTVARRQFTLGRLSTAAAVAGLVGVALTVAVAAAMIFNPISEAPVTNPAPWHEARQQQLRIEYGQPAVMPMQWDVEQRKHLQREYGAPATGPLDISQEQQKHLQREYGP